MLFILQAIIEVIMNYLSCNACQFARQCASAYANHFESISYVISFSNILVIVLCMVLCYHNAVHYARYYAGPTGGNIILQAIN